MEQGGRFMEKYLVRVINFDKNFAMSEVYVFPFISRGLWVDDVYKSLWDRRRCMAQIREVVQQVLQTGYLTIEAENQLRQLLSCKYDTEDLNAFLALQQAALDGYVKQESRERFRSA
jgi:hypothetical protein